MQASRQHPIFSRLGCGATLLLVGFLAVFLYFQGGGPFNPGTLSAGAPRQETLGGFASHIEFENQCAQCHAPWRGIAANRCEACHENVATERNTGRGLHGLLGETADCADCHTEHQGATAQITRFDRLDSFDHTQLTGFSLAHHSLDFTGDPLACSSCHQPGRYAAEFLNCIDCHRSDYDRTTTPNHATAGLSTDCTACHY